MCGASVALGYVAMLYLTRLPRAAAGADPMSASLVVLVLLSIDLRALDPRLVLWPLLLGIGVQLILSAVPLGRQRPDLGRLRRLDVDERVRQAELRRSTTRSPLFTSGCSKACCARSSRMRVASLAGGWHALVSRAGATWNDA